MTLPNEELQVSFQPDCTLLSVRVCEPAASPCIVGGPRFRNVLKRLKLDVIFTAESEGPAIMLQHFRSVNLRFSFESQVASLAKPLVT